jgi:hypothetical protein
MGGQAGFSRDMLDYSSDSSTLMAGFKYQAKNKTEFGIDFSYMQAEAALAPFDLPADEYVAITPPMSYDFSTSHLNSDIDNTRLDADLWAKFSLGTKWWLRLRYHLVDFQDDAPYLYDTSGKYQYATAAVGLIF